jgi:hypothetical protein
MDFSKDELLTMRDILEQRNRKRLYQYTNETGDNIEKEKNLLDKVIKSIVASEIGCKKEVVFNWDGEKK